MKLPMVTGGGASKVLGTIDVATVYGTLLNFDDALAALGDATTKPPYGKPPQAPVLYIKPANTFAADGAQVVVPAGVEALEVGAALAVVFARRTTRVDAARALESIAGYVVAADISIPHPDYYRPSVPYKCRDGFLPLGPAVVARDAVPDPDHLTIRVRIDGKPCLEANTAHLIRPVAQLIAEISSFMSFEAGDVLLVGVPGHAPRARAGARIEVEIEGVGVLHHQLVEESKETA